MARRPDFRTLAGGGRAFSILLPGTRGLSPGGGGGGTTPPAPVTRYAETTGGQSLMAYRYTRGTPRVKVWSGGDMRTVLGLAGSATFNLYNPATNIPIGTVVHNGSSQNAEDWTVRYDNYALGGTSLIDIDAGTLSSTSQYWWNTQNNTAATGNSADTANSPGPLARNWIAGITARKNAGYPFDAIKWSQGENDIAQAGTNAAVYEAALTSLFAAIRAANGNANTPIFMSRLGRGQNALDSGVELIRQAQRNVAAAGTAIYFAGDQYPLKWAATAPQTVTFAAGASTITVPDATNYTVNTSVLGLGIPEGAYVSAVASGVITLSTLVNGVVTPALTTQAVTGGTIYAGDGTHPYPSADGVEPGSSDTSEGFYRLEAQENRFIANKLGINAAPAYEGPRITSATFVRGSNQITVNATLQSTTATDITATGDTTGWFVFDGTAATQRTVLSVVKGAPSGGVVPFTLTLDRDIYNTPQVQYARGALNRINRATLLFDNSTPFPLPMRAASVVASAVAEPTYQAETNTLAAAMTAAPTVQRKAMIDRRISKLKTAGFWALKDVDYVPAAADAQAASLNWKAPASNALTITGVETFTADRGYAGAADASASLVTGYDPSAASLGLAQNDAHMAIYPLTAGTASTADISDANNRTRIIARNSAAGRIQVNSATLSSMTDTQIAPAHFMAVRRDASNQLAYRQGNLVGTFAVASSGLPGAITSAKTDRQIAAFSVGRAPTTDAMALAAYQADRDYLQAIGAIA
jgi:hypothetical protein